VKFSVVFAKDAPERLPPSDGALSSSSARRLRCGLESCASSDCAFQVCAEFLGGLSIVRRVALVLTPWLAIVAAWYAIHYSGLINPALVPAPHAVAAQFWQLLRDRLLLDILMSTKRVLSGVLLGIALAVPAGFVLGWYRDVRTFVDPLINFFRALPPIALIPLVMFISASRRPRKPSSCSTPRSSPASSSCTRASHRSARSMCAWRGPSAPPTWRSSSR